MFLAFLVVVVQGLGLAEKLWIKVRISPNWPIRCSLPVFQQTWSEAYEQSNHYICSGTISDHLQPTSTRFRLTDTHPLINTPHSKACS